jgi:hypothetical protein
MARARKQEQLALREKLLQEKGLPVPTIVEKRGRRLLAESKPSTASEPSNQTPSNQAPANQAPANQAPAIQAPSKNSPKTQTVSVPAAATHAIPQQPKMMMMGNEMNQNTLNNIQCLQPIPTMMHQQLRMQASGYVMGPTAPGTTYYQPMNMHPGMSFPTYSQPQTADYIYAGNSSFSSGIPVYYNIPNSPFSISPSITPPRSMTPQIPHQQIPHQQVTMFLPIQDTRQFMQGQPPSANYKRG